MAGKNQVTLTFAGDSDSLERSFDRVGSSAKNMGDDVDKGARSFDRVGEAADTADTRAMGFRDTITGVQDVWKGATDDSKSLQERVLLLGMGFGDLASGVANFGVQFAQQAAQFVANTARMVATHVASVATTIAGWVAQGAAALVSGAQMAAAWLIGLGPIGLVIAAIAAIIAILALLGVDFDDVKNAIGAGWDFIRGAAMGVFNWLKENWPLVLAIITGPIGLAVLAVTRNWQTIKDGFTAVKNWIRDRVNDVVGFITGIPDRIASAASSIGSTIVNGIKGGITGAVGFASDIAGAIKGAINSALHLPFTIHGPGPLPDFTIPAFHTGGTFRAPPGEREGLALLLDGERVLRPGQNGGGSSGDVHLHFHGPVAGEREFIRIIRDEFQRGGFANLLGAR